MPNIHDVPDKVFVEIMKYVAVEDVRKVFRILPLKFCRLTDADRVTYFTHIDPSKKGYGVFHVSNKKALRKGAIALIEIKNIDPLLDNGVLAQRLSQKPHFIYYNHNIKQLTVSDDEKYCEKTGYRHHSSFKKLSDESGDQILGNRYLHRLSETINTLICSKTILGISFADIEAFSFSNTISWLNFLIPGTNTTIFSDPRIQFPKLRNLWTTVIVVPPFFELPCLKFNFDRLRNLFLVTNFSEFNGFHLPNLLTLQICFRQDYEASSIKFKNFNMPSLTAFGLNIQNGSSYGEFTCKFENVNMEKLLRIKVEGTFTTISPSYNRNLEKTLVETMLSSVTMSNLQELELNSDTLHRWKFQYKGIKKLHHLSFFSMPSLELFEKESEEIFQIRHLDELRTMNILLGLETTRPIIRAKKVTALYIDTSQADNCSMHFHYENISSCFPALEKLFITGYESVTCLNHTHMMKQKVYFKSLLFLQVGAKNLAKSYYTKIDEMFQFLYFPNLKQFYWYDDMEELEGMFQPIKVVKLNAPKLETIEVTSLVEDFTLTEMHIYANDNLKSLRVDYNINTLRVFGVEVSSSYFIDHLRFEKIGNVYFDRTPILPGQEVYDGEIAPSKEEETKPKSKSAKKKAAKKAAQKAAKEAAGKSISKRPDPITKATFEIPNPLKITENNYNRIEHEKLNVKIEDLTANDEELLDSLYNNFASIRLNIVPIDYID